MKNSIEVEALMKAMILKSNGHGVLKWRWRAWSGKPIATLTTDKD